LPCTVGWTIVQPVRLRCLLVDDNRDFLASAARLLAGQGVDVVGEARTSAEALELARTTRPDVALVDVELDDESGVDVARALAASVPATAVVLISTHDADELAELVGASRAVGFLPKSRLGADAIAGLLRP
jgi:DNA-binding NarL/FixJ family response regulator